MIPLTVVVVVVAHDRDDLVTIEVVKVVVGVVVETVEVLPLITANNIT